MMAKSTDRIGAGRQVELIIRKLQSLSTLPEVASGFLSHLAGEGVNAALVSDIIESDPALTAKVLSLAHEEGIVFTDDIASVGEAVAKLPGALIRDAVLSVKVFQAFDRDFDPDSSRALPRKQLAVHSLAVACCAKEISQIALDASQSQLAFSAGLLHDIGKTAIDEVMPRSFEKIVDAARSANSPMHIAEQANLGVDHTIIGKRLAEKWSLPREVVFAIWLHHSDIEVISANMPTAKIALVVRLADIIARQSGMGLSGSFDVCESTSDICRSLSLSDEQLKAICGKLPEEVMQRSRLLGLTERGGESAYRDLIAGTAEKLACDNTNLSRFNTRTGANSAQMDFVSDFLGDLGPNESATDIAARFAAKLQRHYQTGPVCVYIAGEADEAFVEMVTVDSFGEADSLFVNVPAGTSPIAAPLFREFVISDAADHVGWLFDQIDFKIDLASAKIAPLLSGGEAVAAVIFEPRMPFDPAQRGEVFSVVASIAGTVMGLAVNKGRGSRLAEGFAELLGRQKETRKDVTDAKSLASLAEMAAGAAHELNNPLAVISGRAQLLVEGETDKEKKQTLKQIQERAGEISGIVEDLMSFARPDEPEFVVVSISKVIDEALGKTREKHSLDRIEAELRGVGQCGDVRVDKSQVVEAIANILSNCLDSYEGGDGPIIIDGDSRQGEESVVLRITDSGCGMDSETAAMACQPFFSVRPAGRKRGMGLARSLRLLVLNKGSISIAGEVGKGTTVTVTLPKA